MLYSCNTYYTYTFYYNVGPIIVVRRKSSTNVGLLGLNQRQSWVRSIHGLDWIVSGWVKNSPLLMNRVGMAPIAKSVLKYINITSIAYLHCLLRLLSGLVLLVPELVGCIGWIGSVLSRVRNIYGTL